VERVSPAVVNIRTDRILRSEGLSLDDWFRRLNGIPPRSPRLREYRTTRLGSGVVIDPDGYVVTNSHVVAQASQIHVVFFDRGGGGPESGEEEEGVLADLVSDDPRNDLAILRVRGTGPFPFVEMGTSADLMVGEPAIAIGNPYGFSSTVTTGVVSALNRSVNLSSGALDGIIQTDASIDPGNSGGPLLNIHGRLIGVNTAIFGPARSIAFAIPVDRVKSVLADLIDPSRSPKRTWVGFDVALEGGGLVVTKVEAGGPAAEGGLRTRDVILSLDGKPVSGVFEFKKRLLEKDDGDRVRLAVRRGTVPDPVALAVKVVRDPEHPGIRLARERLGLDLEVARVGEVATRFKVLRVRPGGAGERLGMKADDVLDSLDRVALTTPDALDLVVRTLRPGRAVSIVVYRLSGRRGWLAEEGKISPD